MRILLALFVALIAVPATVSAQTVPVVIPVQGILTDAQEQPVNGNVAMTFTIYDQASASLFAETLSVDVENGFYSVNLGESQALSAAYFRSGEAVQLGIKVGGDAEMSPRLDFGSVPYAFVSEFAIDAAHALTADNAQNAQNAANVANGAISTTKIADGAVTFAKLGGTTQVYRVSTNFCEQEVGTLMTTDTCRAWQYNVDQCTNSCPNFQQRVRDCNGNCSCTQALFCIVGQPCPPTRGPACANTPAGYLVNP